MKSNANNNSLAASAFAKNLSRDFLLTKLCLYFMIITSILRHEILTLFCDIIDTNSDKQK